MDKNLVEHGPQSTMIENDEERQSLISNKGSADSSSGTAGSTLSDILDNN